MFGKSLSPDVKVSLLTCGAGTELYSTFGHSAIWISDPLSGTDIVYNYGTFDFNTPNFYVKFTRGQLPYMLDSSPYNDFVQEYIWENRSVYQQTLNYSQAQAQRLYDLLEENIKPENKFYKYDFFFDNCSTRIRDILRKATDSQLEFKPFQQPDSTLRVLLDPGVNNMPWTQFGFYLGLGSVTDRSATYEERMFLPKFLMHATDHAQMGGKPLVTQTREIFKALPAEIEKPSPITPAVVFWSIFVIIAVISWFNFKSNTGFNLSDHLLFGSLGLFGFFILFLWFGTDHATTKNNLNIIWAFPLHFVVVFLFRKPKYQAFLRNYFLFVFIFTAMMIATFGFFPQKLHPAVLPILLSIIARSFLHWYRLNNQLKQETVTS